MKVALGIPIVGDYPEEGVVSLCMLSGEIARKATLVLPRCRKIYPYDRARNVILAKALEYECDYLMFQDADITAPPGGFGLLLDAIQTDPEHIACAVGHFYRSGYPFTPTWFKEKDHKSYTVTCGAEGKPVDIDASGLAFALINIPWVKTHLTQPWFSSGKPDEFGTTAGEDVRFCVDILAAAGRVVGVPAVRCVHFSERIGVGDGTVKMLRQFGQELEQRENHE